MSHCPCTWCELRKPDGTCGEDDPCWMKDDANGQRKEMTMETIQDIVTEMREFADKDSQTIGRDVLRRTIQHFADRIKVAVAEMETTTPTCQKSLQVGNAAKTREALEGLIANIEMRSSTFGLNVMVDTKTFLDAKAALSAPARNCDLYTEEQLCEIVTTEAQSELSENTPQGIRDIVDIVAKGVIKSLFAEAKGEMK